MKPNIKVTTKTHRFTMDQLAKAINEKCPGYRAVVTSSYSNTDRKIAGTRLIHPGKGRNGKRIQVFNQDNRVVLDWDTSWTYRRVFDAVVRAIEVIGKPLEKALGVRLRDIDRLL